MFEKRDPGPNENSLPEAPAIFLNRPAGFHVRLDVLVLAQKDHRECVYVVHRTLFEAPSEINMKQNGWHLLMSVILTTFYWNVHWFIYEIACNHKPLAKRFYYMDHITIFSAEDLTVINCFQASKDKSFSSSICSGMVVTASLSQHCLTLLCLSVRDTIILKPVDL